MRRDVGPMRRRSKVRRSALALALLAGVVAMPAHAADPPENLAQNARSLEELGAYGQAADMLAKLMEQVPNDADLALALALDRARIGHFEEAAELLWGPLLSEALVDSLPLARRREYPWGRDRLWINGTFDGWYWYIARARCEVAAALGDWDRALEAAKQVVAARVLAGKEWHMLALCAAHTGNQAIAQQAAERAAFLDPTLPEPRYLLGLFAWQAKRRPAAQAHFQAAVALDSTYQAAALALMRSSLPFGKPDPLPKVLLTGIREAGLLTERARPKPEEFVQMDKPATLIKRGPIEIDDDAVPDFEAVNVNLAVLVDTNGDIVLHELPWFPPKALPEQIVGPMLKGLLETKFRPAEKGGQPHLVWASVALTIAP